MRPSSIGPKSLYFNHGSSKLSTANFGNIDAAYSTDTIYPYAYTATVNDTYDAYNFLTDDAGSVMAAGQTLSFGLFLSPQNDCKNLLFQVSGKVVLGLSGTSTGIRGGFFFGRKATDNTVVSSLAAASNQLAKWTYLPSQSIVKVSFSSAAAPYEDNIQTDIFSYQLSGGYVYCFGYTFSTDATNTVTCKGGIHLSFRKYSTEIPDYRPTA